MGGQFLNRDGDRLEDGFRFVHHLVVAEAEHLETSRSQPCVPDAIVIGIIMVSTVELDDESGVVAHEVADVPTDGFLSAELCRNIAPNVIPEEGLLVGEALAKLLGASLSERMSWESRHEFRMRGGPPQIKTSHFPFPSQVPLPPPQGEVAPAGRRRGSGGEDLHSPEIESAAPTRSFSL